MCCSMTCISRKISAVQNLQSHDLFLIMLLEMDPIFSADLRGRFLSGLLECIAASLATVFGGHCFSWIDAGVVTVGACICCEGFVSSFPDSVH